MSTDTFKMLSKEEKEEYWKAREQKVRDMYKFTLALEKMEVHKPKFNKTKENEESELV